MGDVDDGTVVPGESVLELVILKRLRQLALDFACVVVRVLWIGLQYKDLVTERFFRDIEGEQRMSLLSLSD